MYSSPPTYSLLHTPLHHYTHILHTLTHTHTSYTHTHAHAYILHTLTHTHTHTYYTHSHTRTRIHTTHIYKLTQTLTAIKEEEETAHATSHKLKSLNEKLKSEARMQEKSINDLIAKIESLQVFVCVCVCLCIYICVCVWSMPSHVFVSVFSLCVDECVV
jgi:hypothetical protein